MIARSAERGAPSLLHLETAAHPAPFSRVDRIRFRNAPMLFAAAAFASGVIAASLWWRPPATLTLASLAMLVLGLLAVLRAPRLALTSALLTWCLLGWLCGVVRPRPVPGHALQAYEDGLRREIVGTVTRVETLPSASSESRREEDPMYPGEAAATARDYSRTLEAVISIDLSLQGVESVTPDVSRMDPAQGSVRLTLYGAPTGSNLACGSVVRLTTRLHPPQQFRDPGVWQREQYLAEAGIVAVGSSDAGELKLVRRGPAPAACRLASLRQWAAGRLSVFAAWQQQHVFPALRWTAGDAAMLNAMLFGDRTSLTHSMRLQFERTGTFHLFVVAGMHVALVAAAAFWLLRRLRASDLIATVGALCVTAAYALVTGFGEPVQRALLMTAAYMAARVFTRQRNVLNAVGVAALTMLIARPQVCFDAGFQMTVLIALAIGGVAAPLLERTLTPYLRACRHIRLLRIDAHLPPRLAQFRVSLRTLGEVLAAIFGKRLLPLPALAAALLLRVAELTLLALTTEIVMALPMAVWFHRMTPLALPANLLVVPLLPLVMVCALATFVLALVSPRAALLPGSIAALLLHVIGHVVRGIGGLPQADWRLPSPPVAVVAVSIAALCTAGLLLRSNTRSSAWCGVALLPATLLFLLLPYPARLHRGVVEVTAIDVGQGDSLLLTGPQGATMLIDAGGQVGPETTGPRGNFDIGDDVVSPYLWSRGIRTLDTLVLTHAHMDHIGGMSAVLRNFRPHELWLSVEPDSPTLHALLADATARGTIVRRLHRGDRPSWGQTSIAVLSPAASYRAGALPANDDSLVLRIDYGNASALLEGDAEWPSEQQMLAAHLLRPVTLLQVGHHGSQTSTTQPFLDAVRPQTAVISCGRGNRFGHPRATVLQRLQQGHVATSRTDTMGAVQYLLASDGSIVTKVLTSNLQ